MPIKKQVTPGIETTLAKESGSYRKSGPSELIPPTPNWLTGRVRDEIFPIAQSIVQAEGEISPLAQEVLNMLPTKLDRETAHDKLTASDLATISMFIIEARGTSSVDGPIGGIDDPKSYMYLTDPSRRNSTLEKLGGLYGDIAAHLTQADNPRLSALLSLEGSIRSAEAWSGLTGKVFRFLRMPFLSRDLAKGQFRIQAELNKIQDDLAKKFATKHNRNDITSFSDLLQGQNISEEQKREIFNQSLEQVYIARGSNRATRFLDRLASTEVGQTDDIVKDARDKGTPQEKFLAKRTAELTEIRRKILSDVRRVSEMEKLDQMLQLMGIDTNDPNQIAVLPIENIVERGINYLGLEKDQAKEVRKDPNQLAVFFSKNPSGLAVFAGHLFRGELESRALARKPEAGTATPEKLKTKPEKLSNEAQDALEKDHQQILYAMLVKFGNGEFDNPDEFLKTTLNIEDDKKRENILRELGQTSRLTQDSVSGKWKINTDEWFKKAEPEALAYAAHRGYKTIDGIMDIRKAELEKTYTDADVIQQELDKEQSEIERRVKAFDLEATPTERTQALKYYHPAYLSIYSLLSLSAAFSDILVHLDQESVKELENYVG